MGKVRLVLSLGMWLGFDGEALAMLESRNEKGGGR